MIKHSYFLSIILIISLCTVNLSFGTSIFHTEQSSVQFAKNDNQHEMIVVATRLHSNQGKYHIDHEQIVKWSENIIQFADKLLIATDSISYQDLHKALEHLNHKVEIILVSPWEGFTMPLNTLLSKAIQLGTSKILFQSVEIESNIQHFNELKSYFDENTLVVGSKLTPEHGSLSGTHQLNALNCPWNTLALWDVKKLGVTGFIHISNGIVNTIPGGMEEVVTISVLQYLYPKIMLAKLVSINGILWKTNWNDMKRKNAHALKMKSKMDRAQSQLNYLRLEPGLSNVY